MSAPVGSVRVTIEGDGSEFERDLQRAVAGAMREVQRELAAELLRIRFDVEDVRGEVSRQIAEAQQVADANPITVGLAIDTAGATAEMAAFRRLMEAQSPITQRVRFDVDRAGLPTGSPSAAQRIPVDVDSASAIAQMAALQDLLRAQADPIAIPVDIDGALARAEMTLLRQQLEADGIQIRVTADTAGVRMQVEAELAALTRGTVEVRVSVVPDMADFTQQLRDALADLERSGLFRFSVPVDIDSAAAIAQMAALRQELERMARPIRQPVDVDVERGAMERARSAVGGLIGSLGSLGRTAGGIAAVAAALAAITGAAGLALGAIGGLVVAATAIGPAFGAAIGTVVVGMQGMKDAFDAVANASEAGPREAEQQAKQVASAVAQVETAERAVQQAKKASADAEADLTRARKDAAEQIEDLNLALRGAALSEQDAALALREAQRDLAETSVDPGADALDRERAALRVAQAEQRLLEVQERNGDLAEEAAEANRRGVEGSEQVIAAKERIADADDRLAEAERQLAQANSALAEAQTASTASAQKLEEALANLAPNARELVLAARDLSDEWETVRRAVQDNLFEGLGGTLRELAVAVLPSLQAGMSAVATEMNLGARGFADFLSSSSGLAGLDATFANTSALLRGMREGSTGFLDSLSQMAVASQPFAESIGRAFGGVGTEIGNALRGMSESGLLGDVLEGFAATLSGLGPLLRDLFTTFGQLGAQVLPALQPLFESLGQTLVAIAPALGDIGAVFARSLASVLPVLGEFISALAVGLEPVLPVLVGLIKSLFAAVQPLIGPLSQIAVTVGQALIGAIDALAPAMGPLGEAFAAILQAIAPLVPLLAEGLSVVIQALAPALTQVATALAPVIAQLAEQLSPIIAQVAPILAEVGAILGQAIASALRQIAPVLPQIVTAWSNLMLAILPLLPELLRLGVELLPPILQILVDLTPVLLRLTELFTWLVQNVIIPLVLPAIRQMADEWKTSLERISTVVSWVTDTVFPALGRGIDTVKGWFENGIRGISTAWSGLMDAAKTPVKFIVETVWNNGLLRAWNTVARFLPGVDELQPVTLPFKRGGVLPGYTPGRDVHRFVSTDGRLGLALSGGEGIARPEVVRALGPDRWDAMNTAARTGGAEGVRRFFGFASGGVIPSTMWSLVRERFPGMVWTSGKRNYGNDFHTRDMASDFATPQWPSAEMQALARWIFETYGPESLELIHWPLNGWENIDDGRPFNFGQPTNDQHRNHVHWAMDHPPGEPGDKPGGWFTRMRQRASDLFGSVRERVAGIFDGIVSGIASMIPQFEGEFGRLPHAFLDGFRTRMREFITGRASDEDDKRDAVPAGGDVEMWRPLVRDLLTHYGLPLSLTNTTMRRMQQESSGRTDAVNLWDINAQNGVPSVGLMQVIRPTYEAYKDPAFDRGPYLYGVSIDPAANIAASMRYVNGRYTGRGATWAERLESAYNQPGGYQTGGRVPGFGSGDIVPSLLEPGEIVLNRRAARVFGPIALQMNRLVPRFQNGGAVQALVGSIAAVPVAVVNWEAARAVLGAAAPPAVVVPETPSPSTVTPSAPAAPAATPQQASTQVAGSVLDALGAGFAQVLTDTLTALVGAARDEIEQREERQEVAREISDQARTDHQGQILSDTQALIERTASSEAEVRQRQFDEQMQQLREIATRLTGGVLAPVVQSAMDAAIGVVQHWLGAGFEQVVDGTDRTTNAVENLDTGGGGAPAQAPPFGAPGSAFDAVSAISDAVVQVANTATQAFQRVAQDIANAALEQQPSRVSPSRGTLGRDISGGTLVDMIVRLTGVEIEIRDVLIDTLDEIRDYRKDLVGTFDASGQLVSDTAALMQRNESSRDLVIAEQNRLNRELLKAVLRYLMTAVVIPIMTAILGAMIQLATTAIGAAIGSVIPGIGTAIGAAIGAVVGAALAGAAAVFTSALAVGAAAAIDSFDSGGVAVGKGLMVKDTSLPERVLSPTETSSYDRLGRIADMLEARERTLTVHAPIYMRGGPRDADRVRDRLLTLMPK